MLHAYALKDKVGLKLLFWFCISIDFEFRASLFTLLVIGAKSLSDVKGRLCFRCQATVPVLAALGKQSSILTTESCTANAAA